MPEMFTSTTTRLVESAQYTFQAAMVYVQYRKPIVVVISLVKFHFHLVFLVSFRALFLHRGGW